MEQAIEEELVLHRATAFEFDGKYRLHVWFDDGREQLVDLEPLLVGPLFAPLRDPALFREAQLDPTFGALEWPNGADIDPMALYHWAEHVGRHHPSREVGDSD